MEMERGRGLREKEAAPKKRSTRGKESRQQTRLGCEGGWGLAAAAAPHPSRREQTLGQGWFWKNPGMQPSREQGWAETGSTGTWEDL